jgi:L-rhamnose-H+ transport protein
MVPGDMTAWGSILIVIGGFLGGSYLLGLKKAHPWEWENIWLVYSLFRLIIVPILMAGATVPRLSEALSLAPTGALLKVFLYGAGWGVGSVLTGLGVHRLGMAFGMSVLVGTSAALGALIPLTVESPELVSRPKGLMILASVAVLVIGLALVGIAGKARDAGRVALDASARKGGFAVGLLICIFGGILACMLNLAFSFSKPVGQAAILAGASREGSQNFVWMVALGGGFLANAAYTCLLLIRNGTWKKFVLPKSGQAAVVGIMMAVVWYAGAVFYGRGATMMGELGTVVGWPIFIASLILFSTAWGFLTGEWKGSNSKAKWCMLAGFLVLMVASGISAGANSIP